MVNIVSIKARDVDAIRATGIDRIHVYRDTSPTGAFPGPTVGDFPLVAGQEDYELVDTTGNANHWYEVAWYNSGTATESPKSGPMPGGPLTGPLGYLNVDNVRELTDFAGIANLPDVKLGQLIYRAESMLQRFADRYGGWNTGVANFTQTLTMLARLVLEEIWLRSTPGARTSAALGITSEKIGTYSYSKIKNRGSSTDKAISPWDIRAWFTPEVVDALRTIVAISPSHVRMQTSMVFPMLGPIPDPTLPFEIKPYWDGLDEELALGSDPLHNALGTRRVIIYPQR